MRRTVPPSAEIEQRIDGLLSVGVGENPRESLSELAKLGARLIIQRAVEEEFDAWLGRARYERRPEYQRGLRNGFRPRKVQSAEGELQVEIPQVREAAEPFVSKLFPRGTKLLRTEPLKAMVIGAFVRGLSMRDVESLWDEAGLGKLSKSTASRICQELRDRFEAFKRGDLYEVRVAALFVDAVFLSVRPEGPKEGVLVAWGFTEEGERVLLSVMLGMRESHDRERESVRSQYWQALDEATHERDGMQRLEALVDQLEAAGYTAASRCLADDLDALVVHLRYPTRHRRRWRSTNLLERSLGEVKRRTKVIGRFPGETSCLTLVWAVLDLYITHAANGIKFTKLERQRLKRMRYEGTEQTMHEEVIAA